MNAGNSRGPGGSATRGQQINADNANPAYVAKLRADVETAETELQAVQNQLALYDPKRIDKIRQENVDLETHSDGRCLFSSSYVHRSCNGMATLRPAPTRYAGSDHILQRSV